MPEFNEDIIVRDGADRQVFHFNDSTALKSRMALAGGFSASTATVPGCP
jgi:hypothetical protein